MKRVYEFDYIAPSLNKMIRMHWAKKSKMKKAVKMMVAAKMNGRFDGKVQVTYERFSTGSLDPVDNLPATAKWWMDAIVNLGIIKDDDATVILDPIIKQHKVKTRKEQKTVITIQAID